MLEATLPTADQSCHARTVTLVVQYPVRPSNPSLQLPDFRLERHPNAWTVTRIEVAGNQVAQSAIADKSPAEAWRVFIESIRHGSMSILASPGPPIALSELTASQHWLQVWDSLNDDAEKIFMRKHRFEAMTVAKGIDAIGGCPIVFSPCERIASDWDSIRVDWDRTEDQR